MLLGGGMSARRRGGSGWNRRYRGHDRSRARALRSAATSAPPETPCMDVPSQRHSKAQAERQRPQAPHRPAFPDVFLIDRAA
jgi:hypothetical protein